MMAPRLTAVPLAIIVALILSVLSPLPAAAAVPGPPVFGPETFTGHLGTPVGKPQEVDCPENSVLRGIAGDTSRYGYLQAVRARCSEVGVTAGVISLGELVELR